MKKRRNRLRDVKPVTTITLVTAPWDMGATGRAAQTEARVIETRGEVDPETGKVINPNGVTGCRFISVAEYYYRRGKLTKRQLAAAVTLLKAWEQKDRTPHLNGDRVDSSPKADDRTAIIIDHMMAYMRVARHVPRKYAAFVHHVARDDRFLSSMPGYRRDGRAMDWLAKGLDGLADNLEKNGRLR